MMSPSTEWDVRGAVGSLADAGENSGDLYTYGSRFVSQFQTDPDDDICSSATENYTDFKFLKKISG